MEIYRNSICLEYSELVPAIMSTANYRKLTFTGKIDVARRGCFDTPALVLWSTLPTRFKTRVVEEYGNPEHLMKAQVKLYEEDAEARQFYNTFKVADSYLPDEEIERCTVNASVLILIDKIMKRRRAERKMRGNRIGNLWESIWGEYNALRDEVEHTLPATLGALKNKMSAFRKEGFAALVNKKYGNCNSAKITKAGGDYLVALKRSVAPSYNTAEILQLFNEMAAKKAWKELQSEQAITNYLNQPEVQQLWWSAVYGEHSAKQKFDRKMRTIMPTKRNALWYGDGTKLNLYYKEWKEGEGWKLATTQVYEVIDAATEMFLGYHISDKEDSEAQYNAFRNAVEFAGELPYEVVVDNQSGWRKLETFYKSICHVFHNTMPRNPQSKTIEQVFGRFQQQVLKKNINFTGANITAKSGGKVNLDLLAANIDAVPTYDEMVKQYVQCRQKWNESIHPSARKARCQFYNEATNDALTMLTKDVAERCFFVQNEKPVTFTASGLTIQVKGKKYTYEPLADDFEPDYEFRAKYTNVPFIVKYDPRDLTMIKLYQENSKGELVYIADAYPYIEVHRAMQDQFDGERSWIIGQLDSTAKQRVAREQKAAKISTDWGLSYEDKGLIRPKFAGMSERRQERAFLNLADAQNKRVSNVTIDQLTAPKISKSDLANKL